MFRKYLEIEIKELEAERKELEEMEEDTTDLEEMIEEAKEKDVPFKRIYIENDITIATLKKITRSNLAALEDYAEYGQPMENLDNGYITPEMLDRILKNILREKPDGSFRKSTKQLFGTRSKIRFVKSKLEELIK